jgi:hypothetical protein
VVVGGVATHAIVAYSKNYRHACRVTFSHHLIKKNTALQSISVTSVYAYSAIARGGML